MEKEILNKWQKTIAKLKENKPFKVRRQTAIDGLDRPMGTLTRKGDVVIFEPAKSMPRYLKKKTLGGNPAKELSDIELMNLFYF